MTESSLLLRQIHPTFVQNGRVISSAFRPTPKDEKRLSVSDGRRISPEGAWKRFTETLHLDSTGVLGVTFLECESISLPVCEDPKNEQPDHMVIDFTHLDTSGKIDRAAKTLCRFATERDWLYRAIFSSWPQVPAF